MNIARLLRAPCLLIAVLAFTLATPAGAQSGAPSPASAPRLILVRIDASEWAREALLDRMNSLGAGQGLRFSLASEGYAFQILYDFGERKVDTSVYVLGPGCKGVEKAPCESGAPVAGVSVFDPAGNMLYENQQPWGGTDAVARDLLAHVSNWSAQAPASEEMSLRVVGATRERIRCLFHPSCGPATEESEASVALPAGGSAVLHTATLRGVVGSAAAGLYGYEYRLEVQGGSGAACLASMILDFGPVIATLDYRGDRHRGNQVFVVATDSAGAVELASAMRQGGRISLRFAAPLCAGATTQVFGMTSEAPPAGAPAIELEDTQGKRLEVAGRLPQR